MIGDARSYNTALIVLDADGAPGWARQHGIEDASLEDLADERRGPRGGAGGGRRRQRAAGPRRADQEVPHRHAATGSPGGDELTPTMKLKRKPIEQKYESEIASLYAK